jgi:DNA-binding NtrC family response regulator
MAGPLERIFYSGPGQAVAGKLGLPEPPSYPPRLLQRMAAYDFPGNVRELEAMVFDAATRRSGRCLDTRTFTGLAALRSAKGRTASPVPAAIPTTFDFPATLPTARSLIDKLYAAALERTGGSQSAAARLIGVSQQTLSNWMRRRRSEGSGDS